MKPDREECVQILAVGEDPDPERLHAEGIIRIVIHEIHVVMAVKIYSLLILWSTCDCYFFILAGLVL